MQFKKVIQNLEEELKHRSSSSYDKQADEHKKESKDAKSPRGHEDGIGDVNESSGFGVGISVPSEEYTSKKKKSKAASPDKKKIEKENQTQNVCRS